MGEKRSRGCDAFEGIKAGMEGRLDVDFRMTGMVFLLTLPLPCAGVLFCAVFFVLRQWTGSALNDLDVLA